MPTPIAEMKNLGPASAAMLATVGITDSQQLQQCDALLTYQRLRQAGRPASLNLVYAILGAQQNQHWQTIKRTQKQEILAKLAEMD